MDWNELNGISQLISSIAVVFSVLYLGIQVRQSTRIAKVAAQDTAATALREVTKGFMEHAELARIWRVGLTDLDSMPAEEQARFFHATHQFLKAFETIHYHYIYGMMDRQLFEGWVELLRHYIVSPGIAKYWGLRKDLFSKRFQQFVEKLATPGMVVTVANLPESRDD